MSNTYTTGQQIREARNAAGLSLSQMAALLGLADNGADHLRKVETGSRTLTGPMGLACWHILNCPCCGTDTRDK